MKDLSKTLIVKELLNTFTLIRKQSLLFVLAAIIDALFFVAFGFFTGPIRRKIVEYGVLIANKLSSQGVQSGMLKHLFMPDYSPLTMNLFTLVFVFFVVLYVLYVAFHGTTWWLATRIAGGKAAFRKYFLGFASLNLIWIGLFMIWFAFKTILDLRHSIIKVLIPTVPDIAGGMMLIVLAFLLINAFVSYPRLKRNELFKIPWKTSAALIILCLSIFLTGQFINQQIARLHYDAGLIIGLIVMFPLLSYIRIYATRVITHVRA